MVPPSSIDQQAFLEADMTAGMDIFTSLYQEDMSPSNFVNIFFETTEDITTFWQDYFLAWLTIAGGDWNEELVL